MAKSPVDYHEFRIWRYEDDSVDISCSRNEVDVDPKIAYLEASVVARTMAEDIHSVNEIFSMRAFSDGMVSTQWRGQMGFARTWEEFLWVKRKMNEACHGGLVGMPKAPNAVLVVLWTLEFYICKLRAVFSEPLPDEEEILDEPAELLPVAEDNVIRLPLPVLRVIK